MRNPPRKRAGPLVRSHGLIKIYRGISLKQESFCYSFNFAPKFVAIEAIQCSKR
jgi:hypothetical protein